MLDALSVCFRRFPAVSVLLLAADILLAVMTAKYFGSGNTGDRLIHWLRQKVSEKETRLSGDRYHMQDSYNYSLSRKNVFLERMAGKSALAGGHGRRKSGKGYFVRPDSDTPERLNLLERIELSYIEKSNIRRYLPFMNVYVLILTVLLIFVATFRYIYRALDFFPSAMVISGILSLTPVFALELLARYNSETIRKRLSEYISILNRWCSVKEDIIYAFEKSLGSNIGEPLQTFVRDMVIQVNRGMDPCEAIDMLRMRVDDPQFSDFAVNIKLSIRHRGDIKKLLTNLENQFYKIDEEYNRRKISTYRDRLLIYVIMFAVLAIAYFFIRMSLKVSSFYMGTLQGKLLLTVFSCMYALGFYLTAGIARFNSHG